MNFVEPSLRNQALATERFGRDVLGPIFAEFAHRLWMFQYYFPAAEDTTLLFCARGGIRLRLLYEAFLAATGLPAPMPHDDLMISRLVAARTCLAAPGRALIEELGREFEGQTMAEVAHVLAQDPAIALEEAWHRPFEGAAFLELYRSAAPGSVRLREAVARQDGAFRRHLAGRCAGRGQVILCDTGLYGSTVRLLRDGVPDTRWFAAQFARSNYKRFATPHFDVTVGLSVERDGYCPWNARTSVLRFWHLVEAVLEPDLESVKSFSDELEPRSNLEIAGWRERIALDRTGLFAGALSYLETFSPAGLPDLEQTAERAWRRLRQAVIWPKITDLEILTLAPRARDFGRSEPVHQFPDGASISASLWREGALLQRYRNKGRLGLVLLEAIHAGRFLRRRFAKPRG